MISFSLSIRRPWAELVSSHHETSTADLLDEAGDGGYDCMFVKLSMLDITEKIFWDKSTVAFCCCPSILLFFFYHSNKKKNTHIYIK